MTTLLLLALILAAGGWAVTSPPNSRGDDVFENVAEGFLAASFAVLFIIGLALRLMGAPFMALATALRTAACSWTHAPAHALRWGEMSRQRWGCGKCGREWSAPHCGPGKEDK